MFVSGTAFWPLALVPCSVLGFLSTHAVIVMFMSSSVYKLDMARVEWRCWLLRFIRLAAVCFAARVIVLISGLPSAHSLAILPLPTNRGHLLPFVRNPSSATIMLMPSTLCEHSCIKSGIMFARLGCVTFSRLNVRVWRKRGRQLPYLYALPPALLALVPIGVDATCSSCFHIILP